MSKDCSLDNKLTSLFFLFFIGRRYYVKMAELLDSDCCSSGGQGEDILPMDKIEHIYFSPVRDEAGSPRHL